MPNTSKHNNKFSQFLHPRHWLTWLALGILRLCACLPYRQQLAVGRFLGKIGYLLLRRRRHIAATNLRLCFPNLTPRQRLALLRENFAAVGIGIMEMAMAWWMNKQTLQNLGYIEGATHLEKALEQGKGVILLSAHFTTLEIAARIVGSRFTIRTLYRKQKNRLFNLFIERGRQRNVDGIIPRDNLRGIIKSLKSNIPVYYAADQDYGKKHSLFIPFFGVPAATITGTIRLASMSGAPVVPVFHYRLENGKGYRIVFHPALTDFPSSEIEQDLLRINQLIEQAIREKPEQYLWIHRRFKSRPAAEKRPY